MIDYSMILSSDLYKRGYDLETLYLNDIAWDYKDILDVIASVKKHQLLILGGDVYQLEREIFLGLMMFGAIKVMIGEHPFRRLSTILTIIMR